MTTTAAPVSPDDIGDTAPLGDTASVVGTATTEPCTLRERKKQQTRQAIHDAALTRITEHGLDGVTVEQICADADVSPRTFFNYFSSKAHAAIGLDTVEVPPAVRDRFAAADGRLVDDVCDLVANTVPLSADRARAKELLVRRPEMTSMVMRWMAESRQSLIAVVTTRTDEDTARTAVALVMSALSEAAHRFSVQSQADLATRLRSVVAEMVALATADPSAAQSVGGTSPDITTRPAHSSQV